MTVIALAGVKHSPGVTTLALAASATRPGPVLLIEADPAGGDIAARAGMTLNPGLVSLAAAARNGLRPEILAAHVHELGHEVDVLTAPVSPRQATTVLHTMGQPLADVCRSLNYDAVVVDLGRFDDPTPALPLLGVADRVVLVLRATAEDVVAARSRLDELQDYDRSVTLAVISSGPFPVREIAAALGSRDTVPLPWDPRTARSLATGLGSDRWLRRSPLTRSARELVASPSREVIS
jgi:MinD-like ATPase involved in chromosome partitioning or flagellar assembly